MVKVYCITLNTASVFPGGVVAGHVLLETEPGERIKARGVRLSLLGKEKVHITREHTDSDGRSSTDHYRAERDIVDQRVTLFGWPKGAKGDPVFLEGGRQYSFPFKFDLPTDCLPSCEYNDRKRIFYRLDSCIDRPWRFDYKCDAAVRVFPNVHVVLAPPNYISDFEQHLTPTACCCFGKGTLRMRVILPKAAYWWREEIPVEVEVDNSQCTSPIRSFRVEVGIVSTYVAKGKVDTHKHEIAVRDFRLSNGEIRPQAHVVKFQHRFGQDQYRCSNQFPTSTIQGQYITHAFVVRAVAKYSFGKYKVELPIFMADGPPMPPSPPEAVGTSGDVAVGKPVEAFTEPGATSTPSAPLANPEYYPEYPTEDSGLMFDHLPSGKWPDDDVPMFERKEEYGAGRDEYRSNK